MRQRESRRLLHGVLFADDALFGGVHRGKPGRGSENRAPFVAAVALDGAGNPQYVRFDAIDDRTGETLAAWPTPTGTTGPRVRSARPATLAVSLKPTSLVGNKKAFLFQPMVR